MPYTDLPDVPVAIITDLGRANLARVALGEISFNLQYFAVGREGYPMANPVKVDPVDPMATGLGDQFFPGSPTLAPIEKLEFPTLTTVVVYCRLAATDAVAGLGEIGIWAKIVTSNVPVEIGTNFLFALAHTPLITKTINQVTLYRFVIQF